MKIRTSFVTNSSSSSFILIGKPVNNAEEFKDGARYIMIGDYMSEGYDVFALEPEMIACLSGLKERVFSETVARFPVVEVSFFYKKQDGISVYKGDVIANALKSGPNDSCVYFGEADYNETDDFDAFMSHYISKGGW